MKTITLAQLTRRHACCQQRDLFKRLFPNGQVEVTAELCLAHAQSFAWSWAASNLLTEAQREAYEEATATALKAYQGARATAWKAYEEAKATAWEAHQEATATASKAYEEAKATAFALAFNS
jgi:hypothetical protein